MIYSIEYVYGKNSSKKKTINERIDELASMVSEGFSSLQKRTDEKTNKLAIMIVDEVATLRKASDDKIKELAMMMANGFISLESSLRDEFKVAISSLQDEMHDGFTSVHRDILSIRNTLIDHEFRITKLER